MGCFPEVKPSVEQNIFTCVASAIISLLTTSGNILIIMAVYKDPYKKLRTPFNYFLVNLAASDLIVGLVTMPISVYVHYMESKGIIDHISSEILSISYFISATASLLSLWALSVDRYIAIIWAIRYRRYLSWSRCIKVSICIWCVSVPFSFLYFKFGYVICLMFYANIAILVGLVVMIVVYVKIYLFLRHQTRDMKKKFKTSTTEADNFTLKRLSTEKKVTRVFLVILFVFVITYIPALIMIYIIQFCRHCSCITLHILRDAQFLLVAANSCVNPFICTIRLKHFWQAIKTIFVRKHNLIVTTSSSERELKYAVNQTYTHEK